MVIDTCPPPTLSPQLSASDALLWNIERDPSLRTTIVAVTLLDRAPDWIRVRERVLAACTRVPRLRQRVVPPTLPLRPWQWREDEHFDLGMHLRRVILPAPADRRALLDLAGTIAATPFDKARAPWEFTVVEGFADGTAAVIQKVHHSFTDGVGAVGLSRMLFDDDPDAAAVDDGPPGVPARRRRGPSATDRAVSLAAATPALAVRAVIDPLGVAGSAWGAARSIGKLVAPARHPHSPVMRNRGLSRWLDSFDVATDDLRAAGHAAGGSLNDAFLAGIVGGMVAYHRAHAAELDALRVTMPISTRRPGDRAGSNRFTPARFTLPVVDADPSEQIGRIGVLTRAWRSEPALPLTDVVAGVLNALPVAASTAVFGSMLKAIDLVATNVPGLTERAWFAGAEVTGILPFAPPSGAALSIALLSHTAHCSIGVNIDCEAVPDPELLVGCLRAAFDRVIASGGN